MVWPDKDPDEILDYQVDWTGRLDGDTIATSTWILPTGITQNSVDQSTTHTTIWLSGGVDGKTYEVTNRITTAGGRTYDQSIDIRIISK